MKLIFEESREGRGCSILPPCDVPRGIVREYERKQELHLPELQRRISAVIIPSWPTGPTA